MQIFALEKAKKIREILCKYNTKVTFVQMVLNERKSIFEFYRIKNVTFGQKS